MINGYFRFEMGGKLKQNGGFLHFEKYFWNIFRIS
jgi:hypothetical protein